MKILKQIERIYRSKAFAFILTFYFVLGMGLAAIYTTLIEGSVSMQKFDFIVEIYWWSFFAWGLIGITLPFTFKK